MAINAPTPITAAPPVPDSGQPEPTFDAQYEAFNTWERQQLVPGANALAQVTYQNALEAKAAKDGTDGAVAAATVQADAAMGYRNQANNAATTATTRRDEAATSASQAEASRVQASKLNLGDKSSPPATDNQGQALRAGATYYDTTLSKWRVWTGTAWGDGISAMAGVKSLNGEGGDLVKTTLAGYGVANFKADEVLPANVNLRTVLTSGAYRMESASDAPVGVTNSGFFVIRSGTTCTQILIEYVTSLVFVRSGIISGGQLCYGTDTSLPPRWRAQVSSSDVPRAVPAATFDVDRASVWTDSVSANKTYTFGIPSEARPSFTLEITHTGGAINFPAAVWPGSTAPSLTTFRRHLFFFQLASNGNAWLGAYLGNYPL